MQIFPCPEILMFLFSKKHFISLYRGSGLQRHMRITQKHKSLGRPVGFVPRLELINRSVMLLGTSWALG